jgi:hypothetical protein
MCLKNSISLKVTTYHVKFTFKRNFADNNKVQLAALTFMYLDDTGWIRIHCIAGSGSTALLDQDPLHCWIRIHCIAGSGDPLHCWIRGSTALLDQGIHCIARSGSTSLLDQDPLHCWIRIRRIAKQDPYPCRSVCNTG